MREYYFGELPERGVRASGFTLFELLVVLVIFGVLTSLAVLSIGDNQGTRERQAASRLAALTELGQETALFNGEDLALSFWQQGYAFYRLNSGEWQPVEDRDEFRARDLPQDMAVRLYLEGLEVELSATPEDKPQVFLLSSGEATPFEAQIGDGDKSEMSVACDAVGNVSVEVLEASLF